MLLKIVEKSLKLIPCHHSKVCTLLIWVIINCLGFLRFCIPHCGKA